ncbi:MAG: hypothetical protein ONB31_02985 [candidate division KSB1 bacterium]|nr:hypothetical protein [candidate division KSB1 bacterium]MDZ7399766.1 hypothetical protein [candidate division KSB1 bacterium]
MHSRLFIRLADSENWDNIYCPLTLSCGAVHNQLLQSGTRGMESFHEQVNNRLRGQ